MRISFTKKIFLVLLSAASFLQIKAQTKPNVYVITSDSATKQILDSKYLKALKDANGKFTINQVREKPLVNQFKYFNKDSSDDLANTYWFRFTLKNESGKTITLSTAGKIASKVHYYIPDTNGVIQHYLSGEQVPWHQKDGFKKNNYISFSMKDHAEITIYVKIFHEFAFSPHGLTFELYNADELKLTLLKDYEDNYIKSSGFFYSVFTGIFLLAAIFNFLIFLSIREEVYLYFSLMLLFLGCWYAKSLSEILHDYPKLAASREAALLWLVFLLHFIRHYFNVPSYYPRWDKLLIIISVIFFSEFLVLQLMDIGGFAVYVYSTGVVFITRIVVLLLLISILVTIGLFLFKRSPERKTFMIAIAPFLFCFVGALVQIIFFTINEQIAKFIDYSLGISIVWAIVVLTMFLLRRYALQEKLIVQEKLEKEQIAREKVIQKSELIAQQKVELERTVEERTSELRQSLEELKSTQAQLIQQEKMASLGELTAGIAHEIQNPLNFVNNFSEVNVELIEELKSEKLKVKSENGELEDEILSDIKHNLQKILQHGKRADAIVKGMLQHSRASTGKKEPTDINALCDEYLRLSYHGLRAKDKNFNAEIKTDFDTSIKKINIVPQDIGRVLLNLFNNAFYAVNEKKINQAKYMSQRFLLLQKRLTIKLKSCKRQWQRHSTKHC
ncbi:MAG: sensor histidine kinase [Ilyomonas sp.]